MLEMHECEVYTSANNISLGFTLTILPVFFFYWRNDLDADDLIHWSGKDYGFKGSNYAGILLFDITDHFVVFYFFIFSPPVDQLDSVYFNGYSIC